METLLALLAGMVVVIAITAATGYFVAQEFAYMAVDRSALRARADAGDRGAARALKVTRRTSFMLSGAQLGITVTGLLVGYVAEPLIGQSLGTVLGGVSVPTGVALAIGAVLALAFSTLIQMLFGELVPKNLAIARSEPTAIALSRSTLGYLSVFGWLITFFDASSTVVLKLIGVTPVHDVEHSASARDLEHIVEESRESGQIPDELVDVLDRILEFPDESVQHAMIPRTKAGTVGAHDTVASVRSLMATGHSRYPVMAVDREDVLGVVHLVDLLPDDVPAAAPVSTVMRPAVLVSTVMTLPEALDVLSEAREQLACVVDEFGGFSGVLSLEDLAEQMVGEIFDEHDAPTTPHRFDGLGWVMPGDTRIDDAGRVIDHELPEGRYETVAGMAIEVHRGFPDVGEIVWVPLPVSAEDLLEEDEPPQRFIGVEVLAIQRHVPSLVRIVTEREQIVTGGDE